MFVGESRFIPHKSIIAAEVLGASLFAIRLTLPPPLPPVTKIRLLSNGMPRCFKSLKTKSRVPAKHRGPAGSQNHTVPDHQSTPAYRFANSPRRWRRHHTGPTIRPDLPFSEGRAAPVVKGKHKPLVLARTPLIFAPVPG